jgi:hypothetical protein
MNNTTEVLDPDWLPITGLWLIYLTTTYENPSLIDGFPNVDAYLYITPDDSIMNGQDFYDLITDLNQNPVTPPENAPKIIGQFTEQNRDLLLQISQEYAINWIGSDVIAKG